MSPTNKKTYNKQYRLDNIERIKYLKKRYNRSIEGLIYVIYKTQIRSSVRRKHPLPDYTLSELREWIQKQPNFKTLYDNWVNSNYHTDLKPSVDRIKDDNGYTFGNIQLMTWGENNKKGAESKSRKVLCFTIDGVYLNEYPSTMAASLEIGITQSKVASGASGKRISAKGYLLIYKDEYTLSKLIEKMLAFSKFDLRVIKVSVLNSTELISIYRSHHQYLAQYNKLNNADLKIHTLKRMINNIEIKDIYYMRDRVNYS